MLKRAFDITASGLAIIALAPAMALIALAIRLESPGPVLYLGHRVGRGGRPFRIRKFRSMVVGADRLGPSSTAGDDPRIKRVGAFLRRWKLDELPQLFNVFVGEMSLVGPRPQVAWAVERYTEEERRLLDVRPGITDWASLHFRDEGELLRGSADPDADYLRLIAPTKHRLGLQYVERASVAVDVKIISATALALVGVDPHWCFGPEQWSVVETPKVNAAQAA